jgi:NitT/TauT family transport system permease protein
VNPAGPRGDPAGARLLFRRAAARAPWLYSVLPLVIAWEAVGRLAVFTFVPPVSAVFAAAAALAARGQLWHEAGRTIGATLAGFCLAAVGGTVVGVLMGRRPFVEAALGIYVDAFQSTPAAAIVPILVLVFGLGWTSIAAIGFLFAFFTITVNVYAGVKHVDPSLLRMARSFGAGEWALVRHVVAPSALPLALAGLRLGIGRAVNGAVLGEMMISSVGIGGLLMYYGGAFQVNPLYALILLILSLSGILIAVIHALERRAFRWTR